MDGFTAPDAWTGGTYEVLLLWPPCADAVRTARVACLWRYPALDGVWAFRDREPPTQPRLDPATLGPEVTALYGLATVPPTLPTPSPEAARVPAATYAYTTDAVTAVSLGLPLGALARHLPVGAFPFDDGRPLGWRTGLDAWLMGVARAMHAVHPLQAALVGWTDGEDETAYLDGAVPDERWVGVLVPDGPRLVWHPPTHGAPLRLTP